MLTHIIFRILLCGRKVIKSMFTILMNVEVYFCYQIMHTAYENQSKANIYEVAAQLQLHCLPSKNRCYQDELRQER